MQILQSAISTFSSDDPVAGSAISLIVLLGIGAIFRFLRPAQSRLNSIRSLRRSTTRLVGKATQPSERRDAIKASFQKSVLAAPWEEFERRWRDSRDGVGGDRSSVRFADALEIYPLSSPGPRSALIPALPGIFLALGILGTFFGLTNALPQLSKDFEPSTAVVARPGESPLGEAPDAKDQIQQRIASMTGQLALAFKTSLWGLVFSLIFSIWVRRLDGGYELEAEELDRLVRHAFDYIDPSELQAQTLRKQIETFDFLRSEFTDLSTELANVLSTELQKIEQFTSGATARVAEEQRQALQKIVEQVTDTVGRALDAQMTGIVEAVERTRENQERVAKLVADTHEAVEASSGRQKQLLEKMDQTVTGLDRVAEKTVQGAEQVGPIVTQLQEAGGALDEAAKAARSAQEATKASLETLDSALAQSRTVVEEQRRLAEVSLGEMREALDKVSTGLGDSLVDALRRIDDVMGQAVGRLSGTIHDSQETLDRLSEPVAELRSYLSEISKSVGEVGQLMGQLGPDLRAELGPLHETMAKATASFGELASTLGNGLAEAFSPVRDSMADSSRGVGEAVERFGAELRERVDPLQSALSDSSKQINGMAEAAGRFEGVTATLVASVDRLEQAVNASKDRPGTMVSALPKVDHRSVDFPSRQPKPDSDSRPEFPVRREPPEGMPPPAPSEPGAVEPTADGTVVEAPARSFGSRIQSLWRRD